MDTSKTIYMKTAITPRVATYIYGGPNESHDDLSPSPLKLSAAGQDMFTYISKKRNRPFAWSEYIAYNADDLPPSSASSREEEEERGRPRERRMAPVTRSGRQPQPKKPKPKSKHTKKGAKTPADGPVVNPINLNEQPAAKVAPAKSGDQTYLVSSTSTLSSLHTSPSLDEGEKIAMRPSRVAPVNSDQQARVKDTQATSVQRSSGSSSSALSSVPTLPTLDEEELLAMRPSMGKPVNSQKQSQAVALIKSGEQPVQSKKPDIKPTDKQNPPPKPITKPSDVDLQNAKRKRLENLPFLTAKRPKITQTALVMSGEQPVQSKEPDIETTGKQNAPPKPNTKPPNAKRVQIALPATNTTQSIVEFYEPPPNEGKDFKGRTLSDILKWTDARFEAVHDYIQVLFPLPETSQYISNAPLIDRTTFDAFRSRPELRDRLREAFVRMLHFYGFDLQKSPNDNSLEVVRLSNFITKPRRRWLRKSNHNHQRISRILRCLRILGLEDEAAAFFDALDQVNTDMPGVIGSGSFDYWVSSAHHPLRRNAGPAFLEELDKAQQEKERDEDAQGEAEAGEKAKGNGDNDAKV